MNSPSSKLVAIWFAASAAALAADPIVGAISVSPNVVPLQTSTEMKVTVVITDPLLIPGGANVQRVNESGAPTSVVGILHDDGLNGDATAQDGLFTLVFNIDEAAAGTVRLRASVAFQGLLQRVGSSVVSVSVGGTATALTISGANAPAANNEGWNNSDVTISYTCTGGLGGAVTCPAIARVSTEAKDQVVTASAIDGSSNRLSTSTTVSLDKRGPAIPDTNGATILPTADFIFPVTDALSGVASVTCNGRAAIPTNGAYLCARILVPGPNAIQVEAFDRAGNKSTAILNRTHQPQLLTIAPTISPSPNSAGWSKVNTTVSFACGGGVAPLTCPPPVVVSQETAGQTVSGTARDSAGTTVTANAVVKLDKTPPSVTVTAPAANSTSPSREVVVSGTALDSLSGVASVQCQGQLATISAGRFSCTVNLVAGLNTILIQATDVAGNSTTTSLPITFASVPLTISAASTPSPNSSGWNRSNVTVTFTCAGGVAPVTCPPPSVIATEGANQAISGTARDATNATSSASVTVRIDKTPPTLAINPPVPTAVTTPQVTITANLTDGLSGPAGITCNNQPATAVSGSFRCTLSLNPGANTLTFTGADVAGNTVTQIATVTYTPGGLTITSLVSPQPNPAGWNNSNATVTFACAGGTAPLTCPTPVVVAVETPGQVVTGTVTDSKQERASTSVTVKFDKTNPSLAITSPAPGSPLTSPVAVSGTASDALSGLSGVTCNGLSATLASGTFNCSVTLSGGATTITVSARDLAGNLTTSVLSLVSAPPPTITLTAPSNLSYLNLSPTTVNGTVNPANSTVVINSLNAAVVDGRFSLQVPLAEGPNIIAATATSPAGGVGTASITVTLDTTPPRVTITSPPDQFVTGDPFLSVAGNINDIVVGTVNANQAQITVNGMAAQVSNRTFLATNVPLALGANRIIVIGRDQAGNQAPPVEISVTRRNTQLSSIQLVSGNNQTATIGSPVPAPLLVRVTDATGAPVPNRPVIFKVTQNNGIVSAGATPSPSVVANTNAQGQAQVQWTLGMRAGAGGNTLEAYSVGFDGTAIFTATGNQGTPGKIVVDTGNDQIGAVGQPLPRPMIAVVVDGGNNRLANVPVTFTVKQGGGSFAGQQSTTVTSDSDGRVAATLTLGSQEGNANNLVQADFAGNQGFPASFAASGRVPGPASRTTISGVVLDNSNAPIPGVTIRAVLTNVLNANAGSVAAAATAQTNAHGQFLISPAPVGFVKLLVDGSTAQRTGTYPSLDYDTVTVAGQSNTRGMPIYLLPLSTSNQLCVTPTTGGGTLTIPEAPGFSLTFSPGQVTFPGGSKSGCVGVTAVHGDKVPMVPGFGQQPRFIVTIQPAGAVFNPPAAITLPNVDGLTPKAVTEMYSFDHDIGSFVAIGSGAVSDDGQVIRSSQGVGVLKAGWHCGGNPNTRGTAADCAPCEYCQGTAAQSATCIPDPGQIGRSCSSVYGSTCRASSVCGVDSSLGFPRPTGVCVQGGNLPDGASCNAGGMVAGRCQDGVCLGTGDQCGGGCTSNDPCTMATCADGNCYFKRNPLCDVCNGSGSGSDCGPCIVGGNCANGICSGGTPVPDYRTCGVNRICLSGQCVSQPDCIGAPDGRSCVAGGTVLGLCQGGQCKGSGPQCPSQCDDGDSCTIDECTNQVCSHRVDTGCQPCEPTSSSAAGRLNVAGADCPCAGASGVSLTSITFPKNCQTNPGLCYGEQQLLGEVFLLEILPASCDLKGDIIDEIVTPDPGNQCKFGAINRGGLIERANGRNYFGDTLGLLFPISKLPSTLDCTNTSKQELFWVSNGNRLPIGTTTHKTTVRIADRVITLRSCVTAQIEVCRTNVMTY